MTRAKRLFEKKYVEWYLLTKGIQVKKVISAISVAGVVSFPSRMMPPNFTLENRD